MSLFVLLHRNVLSTSLNICQTFAQTHIIHISLPEICNYLYTQKWSFQCLGNKVFLCGGTNFLSSCAILGKKWIWKYLHSLNSSDWWTSVCLKSHPLLLYYTHVCLYTVVVLIFFMSSGLAILINHVTLGLVFFAIHLKTYFFKLKLHFNPSLSKNSKSNASFCTWHALALMYFE